MHRYLCLIIASTLCVTGWAQDITNLAANPGFEEIEAGEPVGWELEGSVDLDNAQFYAGAMGLRMRHDDQKTSRATTTIKAGSREYLLLARVRTEDVEGTGARVRVLTDGTNLVAESTPIAGTEGWQQVSVSFNPGGVSEATIELALADATGAAWFDEVTVGPRDEVAALLAEDEQQPERENIALGADYTLSPPPSYEYCTDPGDEEQLTDGEYTQGYFWTQESTVGWYLYSPQILVDLGEIHPIDGIMINCPGGGRAGVKFPAKITYYVSDDGEQFHEVAQLTPAGLKQDGSTWYTHKFLADDLNTRGRYVLISLEKEGSTVFADELEVYPGDHDPDAVSFATDGVSRMEMAFAQYGITPRTYHRGEFPESPHVKWATPLSGGPVRAIVMAYSGDMRDVCEIAQRVDLDHEPVQHFSFYRPTELGGLMREQIEDTLPEAEVMIVGGFRWEAMPEALRDKVIARVREGMGLVCVSEQPAWLGPIAGIFEENPLAGDQGILDGIAVEALPEYRERDEHFHLGTLGEGRIAHLRWGEFTGGAHSLLPEYDLDAIDDDGLATPEIAHAAFAKLILWAAQREPQGTPATVERVWRDRQFDEQARETVDATPGALTADPEQRCTLAGRNTVSTWLRDPDGAIVDFAVHSYVVEHDARIESVEMAREVFEPGQPVEATVQVVGDVEGLTLSTRLVDTYGRLLGEGSTPVTAGGEVPISLPAEHPLTLAADLHTELRRGDEGARARLEKRLDRAWFAIEEDIDELIFCAWYAWDRQPTANWGLRMLEEMGVDTYVSLPGAWRARSAAYANMRHGPENVRRVHPANTDDSLVREPCLTDPQHRAEVEERVANMAAEVRPYGVVEWSLGDESTLGRRNYCHSETCLAEFRTWLQREHDSLEALNASWGTQFATWDDVVPKTLDEVEGQANLGPWLEHRRYMEWLFTDYHWWLREVIEEQIPEARVGISGTPRPNAWSGHDWWQLMQNALTHLSGYGGVQRELQRSFMKPGTFYSTFLGYDYKDNDEQKARYSPWDLLLHDASGINYYTLVSNSLNCPLVLPDGSMSNHAGWFFPEVQELKRGIGRLLIAAEYEDDGIAVHYSPPSVHAATASGLWEHSNHLRNWQMNVTNVGRILQQAHYQFDFIHEDQMVAGELENYRVLLLPWSGAISEAEAEAIREFVRGGGSVIADCWAGVRDGHGRAREMLADVFGLHQPLEAPPLEHGTLTISDRDVLSIYATPEVPVATGSAEIELDGGEPMAWLGKTPALIYNGFGEGTAVFLNCAFSNYAQVRATGVAGETQEAKEAAAEVTAPIRLFMGSLMDTVGVGKGGLYVDGGESDPRAHKLEVSRLNLGDMKLVGIVRSITEGLIERDDTMPFRVRLSEDAHVYDVRAGEHLGKTSVFEGEALRGVAHLYALLPYRVTGLTLAAPEQSAPGAVLEVGVEVAAEGGQPGAHVVHIDVIGPGEEAGDRYWLQRNVTCEAGRASTPIPLALSDPTGEWTIVARDVISGEEARATVTVAP